MVLGHVRSQEGQRLLQLGGILASLIIAGYYAVIAGFVINYGFISASGVEAGAAAAVYEAEKANFWEMTFWFSLFLFSSGFVVANGIDKASIKQCGFYCQCYLF